MGADCKSVGESLHRFESCTCHHELGQFGEGLGSGVRERIAQTSPWSAGFTVADFGGNRLLWNRNIREE